MISTVGIKNILVLAIAFLTFSVNSQVTNAKIVFERKTNLEKMFKDNPRVKPFLKEGVKYKIEKIVFFSSYFYNNKKQFYLPCSFKG